jgi:outer membrane protein assembly factor BamD (BamD/ComL family)
MLGKARLALNDAQSALEAFARAQGSLTAPADLLETKFWQAEALFRLKRFGEARTAYDEIVRTDAASPLAPEALYGYAWTELELQRPEPAVTALREFLTTWPEHALAPSATLHLARAQVELKRAADALPLLTAFATKYPNSKLLPDAQYLLGWVKVNSGVPRGGRLLVRRVGRDERARSSRPTRRTSRRPPRRSSSTRRSGGPATRTRCWTRTRR